MTLADEINPLNCHLKSQLIDDQGVTWSYEGVSSGMDYLTQMTPDQSVMFRKTTLEPLRVEIERGGEKEVLYRHYIAPEVSARPVGKGILFEPKDKESRVVIVLGGSGGGIPQKNAALLASHGIASLALPYFRAPGLPDHLARIPLEYFEAVIDSLRKDFENVSLLGTSMGGELSLHLASRFQVDEVIALVPSSVSWGGFPDPTIPAWTYRGRDLPIARFPPPDALMKRLDLSKPIQFTPVFKECLSGADQGRIPLEKINCPVTVFSCGDDQMWPSGHFGREIEKAIGARHIHYEKGGHALMPPYWPTTAFQTRHPVNGLLIDGGGDAVGHSVACVDMWEKVLMGWG